MTLVGIRLSLRKYKISTKIAPSNKISMYKYESVKNNSEEQSEKLEWTPFMRQLYVNICLLSLYFSHGMLWGTSTVAIPQMRKEANSTEAVSEEMASWLSSIIGFAALPWAIILPTISYFYGRKLPTIIASTGLFFCYLSIYFGTTAKQLLISISVGSIANAFCLIINFLITSEYTSPEYRGIFCIIETGTWLAGICAANAIGTYMYWKTIAIFGMITSALTLGAFFWHESPYWLASKHKFEDCRRIFRYYRGSNKRSEEELESLISIFKTTGDKKPISFRRFIRNLKKSYTSSEFYTPVLLVSISLALQHSTGKLACSVYILRIMKEITSSEHTAYTFMIILDGVTIISIYAGSIGVKYFTRRAFLFVTTAITIMLIFSISGYLYLVYYSVINENKYIVMGLLGVFSFVVSCGPVVMTQTIYADLIPIKSRTISVINIKLFSSTYTSTVLIVSSYVYQHFGLHVAFLLYGLTTTFCCCILYKYLPETKDKTIIEISNYFKSKSIKSSEE